MGIGMYCTGSASSDRQMHSARFNDHVIWLRSSSCGLIPLSILHTAVDDAVAFSSQSSSDGCTRLCLSVYFEIDHFACLGSVWRSNICEVSEYPARNTAPLCAVLAPKGL